VSLASARPDFGRIAGRYDELRPADEAWQLAVEALVREGDLAGRRVLDVGCGTGRLCAALEALGSRTAGVDASAEMLAVARSRLPEGTVLEQANAESLPFGDASFDRVTMQLSVHLLDRPAAFAETVRVLVPGGRIAICTFDPASFERFFLCRLFPSVLEIDLGRFPPAERLEAELLAAGLEAVRVTPLYHEKVRTKADTLERIRGRYISTLQLIGDEELEAGLARAERELPERFVVGSSMLVVVAD
jgi:ubiquinone/menaquinone biosynthesis C-methylase UbiE